MPYYRRRRSFRRRSRRGPFSSYRALASFVRRIHYANAEQKHIDHGAAGVSGISTTGSYLKLTGIGNGATGTTRVGDRVWIDKIFFHFNFYSGSTALGADDYNWLRVVFFQVLDDDAGYVPTVSELFRTGVQPSSQYPFLQYSEDASTRFKVIWDRIFKITSTDSGVGPTTKLLRGWIPGSKCVTRVIDYNTTSTSGKGNLYFYVLSDSGAVGHPQMYYQCRVYFKDL